MNRKRKWISMIACASLVAATLTACGGSTGSATSTASGAGTSSAASAASGANSGNAQVKLSLGHVVAEGTPIDLGDHYFADQLSKATNGRIEVDVYPNSALGDNRAMLESLQMGTLDMMSPAVAALSGFTDSTAIFDLPFQFKNTKHAEAVLDGDIGQGVFTELKKSKIIGLVWMTQGWRELSTSKTAVHKPSDLKGLKIRTMDNEIHIATWNTLGASAVPMSYSEVFTSLQQGVLDAQENPMSNIYLSGFYEVQKYIVKTNHIYDPIPLIISQKTWDSLSADDQAAVKKCAEEAKEYERKITQTADDKYEKQIAASGKSQVITLTDDERSAFRKACQPIYDKYASKIGQSKIDEIASMANNY